MKQPKSPVTSLILSSAFKEGTHETLGKEVVRYGREAADALTKQITHIVCAGHASKVVNIDLTQ
jgi:hypothetical protein